MGTPRRHVERRKVPRDKLRGLPVGYYKRVTKALVQESLDKLFARPLTIKPT